MKRATYGPERYAVHKNRDNLIGKGTFGSVFKARDTLTNKFVAVKRIDDIYECDEATIRAIRELRLMRLMDHQHILSLSDAFFDAHHTDKLCIVSQYCEYDLGTIIKSCDLYRSIAATPNALVGIIKQSLEAIKYMHSVGVIHRDFKPQNVLLDLATNHVKVCDFGMSRVVSDRHLGPEYYPRKRTQFVERYSNETITEYVATRWYRAPEITLSAGHYGMEQDIWSAGCTFAELILLRPLFPGKSCIDQLITIFRVMGTPTIHDCQSFHICSAGLKYIKSLPIVPGVGFDSYFRKYLVKTMAIYPLQEDFIQQFIQLACGLLTFNPSTRLTSTAALMHPLFYKIDDHPSYPDRRHSGDPLDIPLPLSLYNTFKDVAIFANNSKRLNQILRNDVKLIHKKIIQEKPSDSNLSLSPVAVASSFSPISRSPTAYTTSTNLFQVLSAPLINSSMSKRFAELTTHIYDSQEKLYSGEKSSEVIKVEGNEGVNKDTVFNKKIPQSPTGISSLKSDKTMSSKSTTTNPSKKSSQRSSITSIGSERIPLTMVEEEEEEGGDEGDEESGKDDVLQVEKERIVGDGRKGMISVEDVKVLLVDHDHDCRDPVLSPYIPPIPPLFGDEPPMIRRSLSASTRKVAGSVLSSIRDMANTAFHNIPFQSSTKDFITMANMSCMSTPTIDEDDQESSHHSNQQNIMKETNDNRYNKNIKIFPIDDKVEK